MSRPRPSPWTQLRAVFRKEVRQTIRDRRVMFMLIVAPIMQLIILGSAVNFDVDRVPAVVVDRDHSRESRLHLQAILADGTLQLAGSADSEEEAMRWLEDGRAAAAIIVPADFGRDLGRGRPTGLQVLLDGSDPNRSSVAGGAVSRYSGEIGLRLAKEQLQRRAASLGRSLPEAGQRLVPRVYYNPRLRTSVYMVPGITAMLLVIVTTIVTSMGLAREKEMGTMEQVLVTPLQPLVLLVGKLGPFVIIGLLDMTLALAVAGWVFDVPMRGSLAFLYGATALYLLSTLGTGLFISTISSNQQQAFMSGFLFMLPAVFLSGNMTPISAMPEWMQPFTWLNPVRYEVEILRAVLLKAAGPRELWPQLVALLLFGVAILGSAAMRFRKRLS